MDYHRIAGLFFNRPLLLTPGQAEIIGNLILTRMAAGSPAMGSNFGGREHNAQESLTFFPAQVNGDGTVEAHTPQASRFYGRTPMSEDGRQPLPFRRTEEGVGLITTVGEWVNRGSWIGASSGLISYEGFKVQMLAAGQDQRTKAIMLDMQSPGGEAIGAFEAADIVRQVAAVKPVWALVNGMACSAAYAIASAASRIVSIPTGISGSIGVVLAHLDISEYLKKEGIKPTLIHAGAHKVDGNPYEPLPKEVRDDLQAEVEDFYSLFAQAVCQGRKHLTDKAVRDTQARTFMGREAVRAGLVDDIASFEQTLAEMEGIGRPAGASSSRGTQMSTLANTPGADSTLTTGLAVAAAAGAAAPTAPAAPQLPAAAAGAAPTAPAAGGYTAEQVAAARAEGFEAGKVDGHKAGTAAERTRIGAILGGETAKGREGLAQHLAFGTDMTPEAAGAVLTASPVAAAAPAGPRLADRMEARTSLDLAPEAPGAKQGGKAEAIDWGDIAAEMAATQPKRG